MKIESHLISTVTTETYQLSHNGKLLTYIDYLNEKGKVIDCTLMDVDGEEINDDYLLEEIQEFLERHPYFSADKAGENAAEIQRRDEKNGLYPDKVDVAN